MKQGLLVVLVILCYETAQTQTPCPQNHPLFRFPAGAGMNVITHRSFGRGAQFRFLIGITKADVLLGRLKSRRRRNRDKPDSVELEKLLRAIGFANGLKDESLTADKLQYTYIPYGTIGNLGGKRKQQTIEYRYAIMLVQENEKGIHAWKITSPAGCFFYFFTKCGNAFYPKPGTCPPRVDSSCCRNVTVNAFADTVKITPPLAKRPRKITICVYKPCAEQKTVRQGGKGGSRRKTIVSVPDYCRDTVIYEEAYNAGTYTIRMDTASLKAIVCKDTALNLKGRLRTERVPAGSENGSTGADTIKIYRPGCDCACTQKWEFGLDAGLAFTGVPTGTDTVNAKSSRARFAAAACLGYNFNPHFQAGLSISVVTLAYRDNLPYGRPAGANNFFNRVFLAKPAVPVQVFGKAMFGSLRLRTHVSLSAGYAFAANGQIQNNGVRLTANPNATGGFVATFGAGVDYFFKPCKWAVGLSTKATWFSLGGDTKNYRLFAFPATVGIRYLW